MKQCPAGDGIKDRGAGGIVCRVEGKTEEDRQAYVLEADLEGAHACWP